MRSYTIPRKAASFLQASASYSRRPFLISSLIISAFITLSQVIICKAGATPRGSYSPSLRRSRPPPARSLNRLKRDRPTNRRKEGPLRREKVPLLSGQSVAEAPSTPSRHPPETASQPELTTMQRGTAFTQAEQTPAHRCNQPQDQAERRSKPSHPRLLRNAPAHHQDEPARRDRNHLDMQEPTANSQPRPPYHSSQPKRGRNHLDAQAVPSPPQRARTN